MVQNVILSARNKSLVLASNNSSEFIKWITERLKTPQEVGSSTIKGIMNKYDAVEHDGVVFRGDLIDFLWENQGQTMSVEIK